MNEEPIKICIENKDAFTDVNICFNINNNRRSMYRKFKPNEQMIAHLSGKITSVDVFIYNDKILTASFSMPINNGQCEIIRIKHLVMYTDGWSTDAISETIIRDGGFVEGVNYET